MNTTTTTATLGAEYRRRGWRVLLYPERQKFPPYPGWPERIFTAEEIAAADGQNIGIMTGAVSGGLADVDLDCDQALTLAGAFLPATEAVFGRASRPESHRLYLPEPVPAYAKYEDTSGETLLELRTDAHQTMVPPSLHPCGERVEWARFGEPGRVAGDALTAACRELAAAALLARHWPAAGSRQDAALALAGGLLRTGWPEDRTAWFIGKVAAAAGDDEADKRATAAGYTAKRVAAGERTTGWRSLGEAVGADVVRRVREWLGCDGIDDGQASGELHVVTVGELLALPVQPRVFLLEPWLRERDIAMVHAFRGVGKTQLTCGVAAAVAGGVAFGKWTAPAPSTVLYIDGEMPLELMQQRIATATLATGADPGDRLRIVTYEMQRDRMMPDISTRAGQDLIERYLDGVLLLVLDNISTLARTGVENEAEGWQVVQDWLLRLRRFGVAVVLVHHSGKTGAQRGTSKREDVLDTVLGLAHPKDYTPADGARFTVTFEKARALVGRGAEPFELWLQDGPGGIPIWTVKDVSVQARILGLAADGLTVAEIAKEVSRHKSNVSRTIAAARKAGVLPFTPAGRDS